MCNYEDMKYLDLLHIDKSKLDDGCLSGNQNPIIPMLTWRNRFWKMGIFLCKSYLELLGGKKGEGEKPISTLRKLDASFLGKGAGDQRTPADYLLQSIEMEFLDAVSAKVFPKIISPPSYMLNSLR